MVGLLSLDKSTFAVLGENTATAYLYALKDDGDIDPSNKLAFQYFPESIQDTKQINWSAREIPGASLPIYQWISSGERAISFTAYFTSDVNLSGANADGLEGRLKDQGVLHRNIDIRQALVKLRQFMMPTYAEATQVGTPTAKAPAKVMLGLPGSGVGAYGGLNENDEGGEEGSGLMYGLMTQCDITYEQMFPNGMPRIVSVALTFVETAQIGSSVLFPSKTKAVEA